jgi:branched-chain amino acid transport system substrate-binding protein
VCSRSAVLAAMLAMALLGAKGADLRWRWYSTWFLCIALLTAARAHAEVLIGDPSPLTGSVSWVGEQHLTGTELAVADLNAKGGVLGEPVRVISVDDGCNAEQALVVAQKLISVGVVFVAGHICSGAAIPTAPLYEAAGVIAISADATNPRLTEEGRANVFRVVGRDDQRGSSRQSARRSASTATEPAKP